jgi:hypothetical protein
MLELSKGKLTTQPDRHTGRGLFFTSRRPMCWTCTPMPPRSSTEAGTGATGSRASPSRQGTSIYLAIALDTPRTLDDVLRAHSIGGDGYTFDRTVVPLQLMTDSHTGLESRAQAKRVATRLHSFRRAELDFTGVPQVGHGFVDELFRVFPHDHPGLQIVPVGMTPRVAAMVESVVSAG